MPGPELNRPSDAMPPISAAGASPTETLLSVDFAADFKGAVDNEGKFAAIREHFELKEISGAADLQPGVLCALRKEAEVYVVEIGPLKDDGRTVDLRLFFSARHAKPAPLAALVDLGRKGSLHRMEPKPPKKSPPTPVPEASQSVPTPDLEATPKAEIETANWGGQQIDLTSFTRLISLAQACGMVPNVDNIGTVRDADFRNGQYLTAYYNIERMCTSLQTAAQQRQQQLRREDIAYRSGKLRMSPREWSQKQARDTAKTQSIDRALSQFRKVMAGLRLRALAAQQIRGHEESEAGK